MITEVMHKPREFPFPSADPESFVSGVQALIFLVD